jgi:nitroimidazol reductase NimA-like FMN-containing flavoprotein (pyridoxamine 5'-phosphate oxidase superfamily)
MMIREMSKEDCLKVLAGARLARLACAHENEPYVVPVYLAYDQASRCLYGFTTPGQKVEWMRANPLVCVEVDEITAFDQWVSVIAIGHYEELPETPGSDGGASGPRSLRCWSPTPCLPGLRTAASASSMARCPMTSATGLCKSSRICPCGGSLGAQSGLLAPTATRLILS